MQLPESKLVKHQCKTFEKTITHGRQTRDMIVEIRHDDSCGNGHNLFSITADIFKKGRRDDNAFVVGGCIHDEIAEHFPELAKYIKWHLCSTDAPMHYVVNTTYHASDKDCYGLRKGEKRQIVNGRTGNPMWRLSALVDGEYRDARASGVESTVSSKTKPECEIEGLVYVPWCRTGEGKEPDLEAARKSAIWSDATLEQLQNKDTLMERLPALMQDFKRDVEELGLTY